MLQDPDRAAGPDRADRWGWLLAALASPRVRATRMAAAQALRAAIVAPVRLGRVDLTGYSATMRLLVVGGYALYGLLMLAVLLSPLAPDVVDRPLGPSDWIGVAMAVGLWASMVLAFLASLGLSVPWRLGVWALAAVPHATTVGGALLSTGPTPDGIRLLLMLFLSGVWGLSMLVVAVAMGARRAVRASTVALTVLGLGGTYLLPQLVLIWRSPVGVLALSVSALLLVLVALPVAVAAGTAFAQVTVDLATFAVASVRDRVRPRRWWLPVAVVATLVLAVGGYRAFAVGLPATAVTVLHTLLTVGACVLTLRFAARSRSTAPPRPTAITAQLGDRAIILGVLLGCWGVLMLVELVIPVLRMPDEVSVIADFVLAAGAVLMTLRAARRGQVAAAILLTSVATMGAYAGLRTLFDGPTLTSQVTGAVLGLLLAVSALRWRRSMTTRRWAVLALGYLVLAVFPHREAVAQPLEALLGPSQIGAAMVGLLWLLLTEAGFTRRGSQQFGRESRTLVFFAYALFIATMVLSVASGAGTPEALNVSAYASIGDAIIGYAVAVPVVVSLIVLGDRDQDLVEASERQ